MRNVRYILILFFSDRIYEIVRIIDQGLTSVLGTIYLEEGYERKITDRIG